MKEARRGHVLEGRNDYAPSNGSGGICLHHRSIADARKWLKRTKSDFERSGMSGYVFDKWKGG